MTDLVAIGLRALAFTAALQAAGVPLFLGLFGRTVECAARPIGALAVSTATVGLVLTVGHGLVEPARLAGELSGIFDASLQGMLLCSDAGTAASVRVLGLPMVAGGSLKPSRLGMLAALMGATLGVQQMATGSPDRARGRCCVSPRRVGRMSADRGCHHGLGHDDGALFARRSLMSPRNGATEGFAHGKA